jgi:hypothetical protein
MISNRRYKIFMNEIYVTFIISALNKIYMKARTKVAY